MKKIAFEIIKQVALATLAFALNEISDHLKERAKKNAKTS